MFPLPILLLLACTLVLAATPAGTWICSTVSPDGEDIDVTLVVSEQEGKLSLVIRVPDDERPIPSARMEGDTLVFDYTRDGRTYNVRLKIDGDTMTGAWQSGSASGEIRGRRKAA